MYASIITCIFLDVWNAKIKYKIIFVANEIILIVSLIIFIVVTSIIIIFNDFSKSFVLYFILYFMDSKNPKLTMDN